MNRFCPNLEAMCGIGFNADRWHWQPRLMRQESLGAGTACCLGSLLQLAELSLGAREVRTATTGVRALHQLADPEIQVSSALCLAQVMCASQNSSLGVSGIPIMKLSWNIRSLKCLF